MSKRQSNQGCVPDADRDIFVATLQRLRESCHNLGEFAVADYRPTFRQLYEVGLLSDRLRQTYQILDVNYGAWQGETGLRRPEEGHPQSPQQEEVK